MSDDVLVNVDNVSKRFCRSLKRTLWTDRPHPGTVRSTSSWPERFLAISRLDLRQLVRRCGLDGRVAFSLYPTGIDQLLAIADAGEVMPPKSTWFEPKLRSGMVVRPLT